MAGARGQGSVWALVRRGRVNPARSSAPAERRRDLLQDALDGVRVVIDAELVGNGQEQGICRRDRRVLGELPDEGLRFGRVGAAEDRSRVLVEVADLVVLLLSVAEVRPIAVV